VLPIHSASKPAAPTPLPATAANAASTAAASQMRAARQAEFRSGIIGKRSTQPAGMKANLTRRSRQAPEAPAARQGSQSCQIIEHDPDPQGRVSAKWEPIFGKDHAQTKR